MADFEKVGKELMSPKIWLWFAPLGFLTVWLSVWAADLVSWGSWELPVLGAISATILAAVWAIIMQPPRLG